MIRPVAAVAARHCHGAPCKRMRIALDDQDFAPEDREVLDGLSDPADAEAFRNIAANAQTRGKTGVELIQENPEHTSRKAVRKLCLKDKGGVVRTIFHTLFSRRGGPPSGRAPLDFMKPPDS